MLKILQSNTFLNTTANAKCGEIFCHNATEFTILCVFCELKSFEYEDFLLHFKNVHFENNLLKTEEINVECTPYLEANVKHEINIEEVENSEDSCLLETTVQAQIELEDERFMNWQGNELASNENSESDGSTVQKLKNVKNEVNKSQVAPKRSRDYKEHKCEYCDKIFHRATRLKLHIKKSHRLQYTSPTPVKCTECLKEFPNQRRLDAHCTKEHDGVQCSYCGRKFKFKSKLRRHIETHTHGNEAKYECDFENCSKRFFTSRQFADHKRRHIGPKNYICDICGFICRAKGTLRVHYRTHSDERPYPCDVCNVKFKSKHQLTRHAEIHTHGNQRNFFCDFENCTKSFFTSRQLADHKRRHTAIKKYVCDVCGYSCRANQSLKIHYRTHTGEMTYFCNT